MPDTKITNLKKVNKGDFVKFVDRDKQGKFSYVGEVQNVSCGTTTRKNLEDVTNGAEIEMLTFEGTMVFDMNDTENNELYITDTKPKGWSKFIKDPKKFKADNAPDEAPAVKTKKQQVFDLIQKNPRFKETKLLKLAKKEIGGLEPVLKNYISLALAKK